VSGERSAAAHPAAVAFCPHPPLLVAEVGQHEPVAVRAPAIAAVRWLVSQPIERIVLLGAAGEALIYGPGSAGSFAGYGIDLSVRLPGADTDPANGPLPLALAVGSWLLGQASWTGATLGLTCDAHAGLPSGAALGANDGLLVMGDASARRTEKAPGWLDERAADHDAAVSSALASGDPDVLGRLDPDLGSQLLAAGVPAWRAASRLLAGTRWEAEISYDDAPYGVGYLVATWSAPRGD
jgi:hypothetical protein